MTPDYSRVVVGRRRFRAGIRLAAETPCAGEDLVYGTNILRDPLFATQATFIDSGPNLQDATFNGGTGGALTPGRAFWFDGSELQAVTDAAHWELAGWSWYDDYSAPGVANDSLHQLVSAANPHAGTSHYRGQFDGDPDRFPDTLGVAAIGAYECDPTNETPYLAACRVTAGDALAWSGWVDLSDATFAWLVTAQVHFYDLAWQLLASDLTQTLVKTTTGYEQVTVSGSAPAGAYVATAELLVDPNESEVYPATDVDVSDLQLSLTAA